jgi:hypothetical protein
MLSEAEMILRAWPGKVVQAGSAGSLLAESGLQPDLQFPSFRTGIAIQIIINQRFTSLLVARFLMRCHENYAAHCGFYAG